MKLSTRPVVALVAAASLLGGAAAAGAAGPVSLKISDAAGDANAFNDQGSGDLPVANPGAGSQAGKDILEVTYTGTKKGKACTGFTATLKLAGPPEANTLYRLRGTGTFNTNIWWLQYNGATTTVRWSSDPDEPLASGSGALKSPVVIAGSTITWKVTEADLKMTGEKLAAFVLTGPGSDIRTQTPAVTAPQWDALPSDTATSFKPC